MPLCALIGAELSDKLGAAVSLDVMRPLQAYDAGGRALAAAGGRDRPGARKREGSRLGSSDRGEGVRGGRLEHGELGAFGGRLEGKRRVPLTTAAAGAFHRVTRQGRPARYGRGRVGWISVLNAKTLYQAFHLC
jgi:hypothetical protein